MANEKFVKSQKNWDKAIRKAERQKLAEQERIRRAKAERKNKK